VKVAPPWAISWIIVFIGVISSIASDAGYLILIPLAAAAYPSVGRHPLAGLAAAYAGVSAAFGVNILIKPSDGVLTEVTKEAIAGRPRT
jgi:aminobenzoyl-glutamate transport protein